MYIVLNPGVYVQVLPCDTFTSGHPYRWDMIADVVESVFSVWVYFTYPLLFFTYLFLDIVLSVVILLCLLRMMAIHSLTYIACAMILKNM